MPGQSGNTNDSSDEETILKDFDQVQLEELIIDSPEIISDFLHEKKRMMLEILIMREMTIRELSEEMDMNPGSIKRHLDSLVKNGLVNQTKITQNQWGIRLKYYNSSAKKYLIQMEFPKK